MPTRPTDAYGQAVYDDDPDLYWRLGDSDGTTAKDANPNEFERHLPRRRHLGARPAR